MYESPITRITEDVMKDIVKREEDYLVESVHKVGFDIDKEELAKALRYDRGQYEKGFSDGRLSAEPKWIPVTERLPEDGEDVLITFCGEEETRIVPVNYYQKIWFDCIFDIELNPHMVTAWMPLPTPWKGKLTDVSCDDCLSKKHGLCTVCVRNPNIGDYYRPNDN